MLGELDVQREGQWDLFGGVDSLTDRLESVVNQIGNQNEAHARSFARVVSSIVSSTLTALDREAGWICIRSFAPSSRFVPRWHTDGRFFSSLSDDELQVKLAFALRGRSTLFADIDSTERGSFESIENKIGTTYGEMATCEAALEEELRRRVEALQAELNAIIRAERIVGGDRSAQGALFLVGHERAAIHSEPEIDTDRIFVSIVPGSVAQIAEIEERFRRR